MSEEKKSGRGSPDAKPKKRRARRAKWVNPFTCGHSKIRKGCDVCATRPPRRRPVSVRLDEKTDKSGGPDACWLWKGACDQNGRAQLYWNGRVQPASRVAWFVATGAEIPPSLYACHRCDNPKCVNPAHLFPGDASANQRDKVAKGRNVYGGRGPGLTDEQKAAMVARFGEGASLCQLAKEFGISRRSVTHHLDVAGARRSAA